MDNDKLRINRDRQIGGWMDDGSQVCLLATFAELENRLVNCLQSFILLPWIPCKF